MGSNIRSVSGHRSAAVAAETTAADVHHARRARPSWPEPSRRTTVRLNSSGLGPLGTGRYLRLHPPTSLMPPAHWVTRPQRPSPHLDSRLPGDAGTSLA